MCQDLLNVYYCIHFASFCCVPGFEILHMDVQEPLPLESEGPFPTEKPAGFVEIPVERRDGTLGVVAVEWIATIDGMLKIKFIQGAFFKL